MEAPNSHHIAEQNTAYRRGLVLGLTMAEVGILIIFALLLLIGFDQWLREEAMEGREAVKVERLRALEEADSLLTELRHSMQLSENASAEEIRRLIRALREVTARPEGQTTLQETRAALEQMRRVRDEIKREGGSEALANQLEQQDRKSTRLNSSHIQKSRMPSSA